MYLGTKGQEVKAIKRNLIGAAGIFMIAAAGTACAADSGFYLGGSVGQSRFHVDSTGLTGSVDKRDTGWNLFGGYQINRHFGVELGYVDLGRTSFNGTLATAIPPFPAGTAVAAKTEATAWSLSLVVSAPFTQQFSGYAKLGANYNDVETTATVGGASGSVSDHDTNYLFGLGLKYSFTPNAALRAGWERYRVGSDAVGGKGDVDLWSLGVQFSF